MIDIFAAFSVIHKKHEILQLLPNQRSCEFVGSLSNVQQFLTISQRVREQIEFTSNISAILTAMTTWMHGQLKGEFCSYFNELS